MPRPIEPTADVNRFQNLGVKYFYYEPDGAFVLAQDPVDLNELAADHSDSPWGRQAFLMMTVLGWSQGACAEGPDQFREVIKHGEAFLAKYPNSEISNSLRLEIANAYATWWNVANMEPDAYANPENYKQGAETAKERAIHLYKEYLATKPAAEVVYLTYVKAAPPAEIQKRLDELLENQKGSATYEYFCEDYED